MMRIVEITGLISSLIISASFVLAEVIAPVDNAGDRMAPAFLIAGALVLPFAVGAYLHVRKKRSGTFGIFCGTGAGGISRLALADADHLGTAGYSQVITAVIFSVAACARARQPYDRSVDVYIHNLRLRLEAALAVAVGFRTVRGIGYRPRSVA